MSEHNSSSSDAEIPEKPPAAQPKAATSSSSSSSSSVQPTGAAPTAAEAAAVRQAAAIAAAEECSRWVPKAKRRPKNAGPAECKPPEPKGVWANRLAHQALKDVMQQPDKRRCAPGLQHGLKDADV